MDGEGLDRDDFIDRAKAISADVFLRPMSLRARCIANALRDAHEEGAAVMAGIIALGEWASTGRRIGCTCPVRWPRFWADVCQHCKGYP